MTVEGTDSRASPLQMKVSNWNRSVFLRSSSPLVPVRRSTSWQELWRIRQSHLSGSQRSVTRAQSPHYTLKCISMTPESKQWPEYPNVKATVCNSMGPRRKPAQWPQPNDKGEKPSSWQYTLKEQWENSKNRKWRASSNDPEHRYVRVRHRKQQILGLGAAINQLIMSSLSTDFFFLWSLTEKFLYF